MEQNSKKTTIFKNISWSVISETIFKLLGFAFFLVFTRRLGQSVLGFYTYIFSILSLINIFWDLGINSYYSRKWVTDDSTYRKDITLINTARILIVLISLVFLIPYIKFSEHTLWLEFTFATLIYVLDLLKSLPALYFQSKNRFDQVFFINFLDRGLGYGLAIGAILAGYNLKAVLVSLLIAKIIVVLYSNSLKPSLNFGLVKWSEILQLLKHSVPLFLVGLFGSLYFRIDSVMIKAYLGFSPLGVYSAAYRLIDTGSTVSSIMSASVFPVLIAVQQDIANVLPQLLSKNMKYLFALSGFMTICGILKANEVTIFLFGNNFAASGPVLAYLSPTLVFLFLNGLLLIQMLAMHEEHYVLKTLIFLALVNIALNLYFIPHYGLIGAAVTTLISEILNTILLYIKLPVKISYNWLPGFLLSLVGAGAVLHFLPIQWMLGVAISAIIYTLLLLVFKAVDLKDLPFNLNVSK